MPGLADEGICGDGESAEVRLADLAAAHARREHPPARVDVRPRCGILVPQQQRVAAGAWLVRGPRHDEDRLRPVDVVDHLLRAVDEPEVADRLGDALVPEQVVAVVELVEADGHALAAEKSGRDLVALPIVAGGPDVDGAHERGEPVAEAERRVAPEDRPPAPYEVLGRDPPAAERGGDELGSRLPLVEERLGGRAHAPCIVVGDDRRIVERPRLARVAEQLVEVVGFAARRPRARVLVFDDRHESTSHPSRTETRRPVRA